MVARGCSHDVDDERLPIGGLFVEVEDAVSAAAEDEDDEDDEEGAEGGRVEKLDEEEVLLDCSCNSMALQASETPLNLYKRTDLRALEKATRYCTLLSEESQNVQGIKKCRNEWRKRMRSWREVE